MKKILITGSKGQLGIELTKALSLNSKVELILTDVEELDITKIDKVMEFTRSNKPDLIINCAAYTAVDNCETNEDIAYRVNTIGPRNLSIASNEINSKIVHISTDYVFDGEGIKDDDGKLIPYNEFHKPNPQSVYGRTKFAAEEYVKTMNPRHFIIRTAWLYGEGKNFVRTMLRLSKEQDTIKVVNDQLGSPTSTRDLTKMIQYLMDTDNYGTFHGTCEGSCTWYEFTREIFRLKGINTNVIPVTSDEFKSPAKRPQYSVLDNYMLRLTTDHSFNTWQEEIEEYLKGN